jgi:hypothetical protein
VLTTRPDEHRPIMIWVKQLQQGERFCVGCGQVAIPAGEPEWKIRCEDCHFEKAKALYCRHCGSTIIESRMDYARARGGECRTCDSCSFRSDSHLRREFNVRTPDDWFTLESILEDMKLPVPATA